MLNFQPVPLVARGPASSRNLLGQQISPLDFPKKFPPFGLDPLTSGIILTAGGLISGTVGTYLVVKGTKAIGKKLPTFWRWYYGTGGIGITMVLLGSVPLVIMGVLEIAGGIIIKKKLEEVGVTLQPVNPSGPR